MKWNIMALAFPKIQTIIILKRKNKKDEGYFAGSLKAGCCSLKPHIKAVVL